VAGTVKGFFHHRVDSYQMDAGSSLPVIKRPGREGDHSPPSSAEVLNACRCMSTPHYVFMALCLMKHWIRLHGVVLK
jgi:hypothetical protein